MGSIYPMEWHLAMKRAGVLILTTTGTYLENTMLKKEANHKRPHTVCFHLKAVPRKGKCIKIESRLVIAEGFGRGAGGKGTDC